MTIEQLANKKAACGELDRHVVKSDKGVQCNALVFPDSREASVRNDGTVFNFDSGRTIICLSVRNDGTPGSIEAAIRLAMLSLATAK